MQVDAKNSLYELFTPTQLQELKRSIEVEHEIPRSYNYFGQGAQAWSDHADELAVGDSASNLVFWSIRLLEENMAPITSLIDCQKIDVIDLGPGNAIPVKGFLESLHSQNRLSTYTAVDISPQMLTIAKKNINAWLGDSTSFFEVADLTEAGGKFGRASGRPRLVLFLGGTLHNFRDPKDAVLKIRNRIFDRDVFVLVDKFDTQKYNFHNFKPDAEGGLIPRHRLIFDLTNIDDTMYEFDHHIYRVLKQRQIYVRFKLRVIIKLKGLSITIPKNQNILVWRSWEPSFDETSSMFEQNGFQLLKTDKMNDGHALLVFKAV